jgi:predicted Zn-dependent peptidase
MAKIDVLDQAFGGSFGARLNNALRIQKGLTYGIRGGFSPRKEAGAFRIRTFSKTPATAEAVRTILEEIDRLQAEPLTEQELDIARNYLTGSFARERETPQAVAGDLWMIESNGLPPDYFEKHLDEAARRHPRTREAGALPHPPKPPVIAGWARASESVVLTP